MAIATASQAPKQICGLILAAAPGRPLGLVLREQLAANPANGFLLDRANRIIESLERGERVPLDPDDVLHDLFHPSVQGLWIDLFQHHAADMIRDVSVPVLVVHGARDLQTSLFDAKLLAAGAPNAALKVFSNANHVLKPVLSEDRAANLATY